MRNKPSALKEARSIDEQEDKCSIECWCKAWRLAGSSRGIWYDPRKILQGPTCGDSGLSDCHSQHRFGLRGLFTIEDG